MQDMERAVDDDAEGERTDLAFHQLLVQATHNGIMEKTFESIRNAMEMMIRGHPPRGAVCESGSGCPAFEGT